MLQARKYHISMFTFPLISSSYSPALANLLTGLFKVMLDEAGFAHICKIAYPHKRVCKNPLRHPLVLSFRLLLSTLTCILQFATFTNFLSPLKFSVLTHCCRHLFPFRSLAADSSARWPCSVACSTACASSCTAAILAQRMLREFARCRPSQTVRKRNHHLRSIYLSTLDVAAHHLQGIAMSARDMSLCERNLMGVCAGREDVFRWR
jgi:hypothetical protein